MHEAGQDLLREWYEACRPRPVVSNWPQATKTVGKFLDAGRDRALVLAALHEAPTVSVGALNVALKQLERQNGRSAESGMTYS